MKSVHTIVNITNPVNRNTLLELLLREFIRRMSVNLQSSITPTDDDDIPVATDGAAPQPQEVT